MKYLLKIISLLVILLLPLTVALADLSPEQAKAFVQRAVIYALKTNKPINYSKYVSADFINHVDGNTFNFVQWVKHQNDIKKIVQSMQPTFIQMIAEGNYVSAVYRIDIVKKDGSKLIVKDIAIFEIKDNKIVYVDELTRLMKGNAADQDIGSLK